MGGLPAAVVDCALYEGGKRIPGQVNLGRIMERIAPEAGRFAWIGLYEPSEEQLQEVAQAFGLHPLAVEDAVHAHQRPKLERYGPDRPVDAGRIYQLKRELLEFKRAVMPLASGLQRLSEGAIPQIPKEVAAYLRDVADLHQRVSEQILSFDELITGMLSASIAQLGLPQNVDMRPISAWTALIAVPTMIVGVWGMNFEHMPELKSPYGYPAVWILIVTACTVIYRALHRNKWL